MSRYGNPLLPWPQKRSLVGKSIPSAVAESVGTPRQCPAFLGQAVLTCWGAWRRLRAGREMESDFIAFFCIPRWCFPIAHFFFWLAWFENHWTENSWKWLVDILGFGENTPFFLHHFTNRNSWVEHLGTQKLWWFESSSIQSSDRSVVWKQIFYQWLGLKARNSFCVPANTVVSCRLPLKAILWNYLETPIIT